MWHEEERLKASRRTCWLLRNFYEMLDQAGIDSCILYNSSYSDEAVQHRQFLRQLSYALIEPYLRMRLINFTLSKNSRACISFMLNTPAKEETDKRLRKKGNATFALGIRQKHVNGLHRSCQSYLQRAQTCRL